MCAGRPVENRLALDSHKGLLVKVTYVPVPVSFLVDLGLINSIYNTRGGGGAFY